MSEDKSCELLQPPRSSQHKKKKKKKIKKGTTSATVPENKEKPLALSSAPDTSPVSPGPSQERLPKLAALSKRNRQLSAGRGRKTKKCHKDSQPLLTATQKTNKNGPSAQGAELIDRARESLRWEGVLQDPQEEAKRLELYRANRRQRYVAHREALSKDTQHASRRTFLKES
ncbi:protein LIAT1 [Kryptolebias marmoratus]|uniref:protein LIAT1 n=1 Tax=Kryptolebias marmoratus TaxID=37003 RepID=UPI0007F9123D|nr:protein LIAT1 [Kryptolebias marmoratus]